MFAGILILFVTVSAFSQSQDRDNPTPIRSNEVNANVSAGDSNQYFYSFVAGPGTLTMTVELKGDSSNQAVEFILLERNGADAISAFDYIQTSSRGNMVRKIVNIKLDKRRTILLQVTPQTLVSKAQYRFVLSGSAISNEQPNEQPKVDKKTDQPKTDDKRESGKSIKIPKTGILVIKMKNGSTKEIDLSLVNNIEIIQ